MTATLVISLIAAAIVFLALVGGLPYRSVLLFAVMFTMPLRNESLLSLPGANVRVGDVSLLLALSALLLEQFLGARSRRWRPLHLLAVLMVLWCCCTVAWSLDPEFGVARAAKFVRNLALFAVVANWARPNFESAFRALGAGNLASFVYLVPLLFLNLASAGLSIATVSSVGATSWQLGEFRGVASSGIFATGINALGLWGTLAIFFWLGMGVWARRNRSYRLLFWAVLMVLGGIVVITFSRGTWLGLAAGGGWWFLRVASRMPRRAARIAVVTLLLITAAAYASGLTDLVINRVKSIGDPTSDVSASLRLIYWNLAWQALTARPIGVGLGGTTVAVQQVAGEWFVHNLYLQLLVELGPIGLVIALAVLLTAMTTLLSKSRRHPDPDVRLITLSLGTMVVAYSVSGMFAFDFTEMEIWVVLALAAASPFVRRRVVPVSQPTEVWNVTEGDLCAG